MKQVWKKGEDLYRYLCPHVCCRIEHPCKRSCQDILGAVAKGELNACTDAEVFQEILYRYFSINRKQIGLQAFDQFSNIMDRAVLPVRHVDLSLVRILSEEESYSSLSPRDLVHLAVMLNNDLPGIVTADQGFTRIPGIQAIKPSREGIPN